MWPFLPKKCNCPDEPTNPGKVCDHKGLTTNDVAYNGPDLLCTGIEQGDSVSVALQILDNYLCGTGFTEHFLATLEATPNEVFIYLVNQALDCEVINICATSSTTTSTSTSTTTTTTTTITPATTTTTTTIAPTTTSTTTVNCSIWYYDVAIHNCSNCVQIGGGAFCNSQPLTVGKWYSANGTRIHIIAFAFCTSVGTCANNISDSSKQDTCGAVICPTTTTTTTVI